LEAGVTVKKILAPIDRSKYKEKIIAYAISLGKAWGAEITAIHVAASLGGESRKRNWRERRRQEDLQRNY